MKKNLYFRTVMSRRNVIKEAIFNFFLGICSYPRLVLEVFLRRNMGERYFTLASAISVGMILLLLPFVGALTQFSFSISGVIGDNWLWYLFVVVYGYASYKRYQEIRREPSVFDFARYSKSDGLRLPLFDNSGYNPRVQEIFLEPLAAMLLGLLLLPVGQLALGGLFIVCAIIYSVSKAAAYYKGDHYVMDCIDEIICNEELRSALLDNGEPKRGMTFRSRFPDKQELREQLADAFMEEDEAPEAI